MIYLVLSNGLVGLVLALYGKSSDTRFLGGMAAVGGLLRALFDWGSW
ncbi:hypothetical protein [Streptomyces zaomyceticus]